MAPILLLEVRQRTRTGRLLVGGAAHIRTDRSLDLFGLPAVGLQIVPAYHNILTSPSPHHSSAGINLRAANDATGRSRSQFGLMNRNGH
ncbi:MAG TPA: hypothetical protein VH643_34185 [Gemmataceae bacterium]